MIDEIKKPTTEEVLASVKNYIAQQSDAIDSAFIARGCRSVCKITGTGDSAVNNPVAGYSPAGALQKDMGDLVLELHEYLADMAAAKALLRLVEEGILVVDGDEMLKQLRESVWDSDKKAKYSQIFTRSLVSVGVAEKDLSLAQLRLFPLYP